jgi:hypothetical protein
VVLAVACVGRMAKALARRSGSGRTVLLAKEADLVTRLVAMGGVTRRPLETKDLDNDCGRGDWGVLMPSTPFAYPQVASRTFASSTCAFPQVTPDFAAGSIPGSSTKTADQRAGNRRNH